MINKMPRRGFFKSVLASLLVPTIMQQFDTDTVADNVAVPQFTGQSPSALCSLLARPIIMTGMLRDRLISHFTSPYFIENKDLQHLIWKGNESTAIVIESIHRWRPELTEKRPAVIVKRGAYTPQRLGIGDRRQLPSADERGNPHYAMLWLGSHTLFCIGGTGAQAEILSTEVQRELTEFGPLIREGMDLHRFGVLEVGAIGELEEATENFVVPVTVGYAFEQHWELRKQAPLLKKVSMTLLTEF